SVVDLFLLFFSSFVLLHTLHSFPTRRSSDLYDARIMTYRPNNVVSLWCLGGRQKIDFVCHKPEHIPLIKGEADLVYKKGKFFLCQTIEVPQEETKGVDDFIGCDFGI